MAEFIKVGSLSQFQPGVLNEVMSMARVHRRQRRRQGLRREQRLSPCRPADGGRLGVEDRIVCPFHGSAFKLATGEGVDGPATGDSIDVYAVRVEGDDVLVAKT